MQSLPVLFPRNPSSPKVAEPRSILRAATQLRQIKDDLENIAAYCAVDPNNGAASLARKRKWVLKQNRISKLLVKARDAKENLQVAVNLHLATVFSLQSMAEKISHSEGTSMMPSPRGVRKFPTGSLNSQVVAYTVDNHQDAKLKTQKKTSTSIAVSGEPPTALAPSPGRGSVLIPPAQNLVFESGPSGRNSGGTRESQTARSSACQCRPLLPRYRYPGPAILQLLLGTIGFSHSRDCEGLSSACPFCSRKSVQETLINIEYKLPKWLWAGVLLLYASFSSSGLRFALRPARIVDSNHIIWRHIERPTTGSALDDELTFYPDDQNEAGQGLIEYAISYRSFKVVEKFILKWESLVSNQGLPTRVASQIHQALDWGHCQADEVNILSKVLSFIDDVPQYNTTLVHLAALRELEMMEALEEEPWAIDQPDRYGMAPIHYASMDGDLEILKMLIWAEADVNISDLDGLTPLMFAALNGHVDCIRLLVDSKCNIEQRSHTEFRAIHYAAQFCQPRSVLALVAAGASASARGWLGQTPLHRLARCEIDTSFEAIKETISSLLVSKGVSIDAQDSNGDTPVFRAVAKGNIPVLRCLVEAGASLLPVNDGSRNMLHMVAMYPDDGILRYLLNLDSGVFLGINTEHRDADGRTPMDLVPIHDPGATQSLQGMTECGSLKQEIQKLNCLIRYANLSHRSEQLRTIVRLVDQKQASCARLQLAHVINEKKEWGQLELASWYRGIDQMIQALDYDKVIIALEDDVQQLTAQIGTIGAAGTSNEGGVSDIFN